MTLSLDFGKKAYGFGVGSIVSQIFGFLTFFLLTWGKEWNIMIILEHGTGKLECQMTGEGSRLLRSTDSKGVPGKNIVSQKDFRDKGRMSEKRSKDLWKKRRSERAYSAFGKTGKIFQQSIMKKISLMKLRFPGCIFHGEKMLLFQFGALNRKKWSPP